MSLSVPHLIVISFMLSFSTLGDAEQPDVPYLNGAKCWQVPASCLMEALFNLFTFSRFTVYFSKPRRAQRSIVYPIYSHVSRYLFSKCDKIVLDLS